MSELVDDGLGANEHKVLSVSQRVCLRRKSSTENLFRLPVASKRSVQERSGCTNHLNATLKTQVRAEASCDPAKNAGLNPFALPDTSGMAHGLPDDNSELVPPDPISNSVVKRLSADGSVGDPM